MKTVLMLAILTTLGALGMLGCSVWQFTIHAWICASLLLTFGIILGIISVFIWLSIMLIGVMSCI